MIKRFVLKFGNALINLCAVLFIGVVLVGSIVEMTENFARGILFLVIGVMLFTVFFYLSYLLMSINDYLGKIYKCLSNNEKSK